MKNTSNIVIAALALITTCAFAQAGSPGPGDCTQQPQIAKPTPTERMQMCELAQNAMTKRIAQIKSVPTFNAGETLADYKENQRIQRELIDMQIHIAEAACTSAFGETTPPPALP